MGAMVRNRVGRFISAACPDQNCDGTLRREGEIWRCDGLTHDHPNSPLYACRITLDPAHDKVPA